MSLIIHYLTSGEAERNDPAIRPTIHLPAGVKGNLFQMVVTVANEEGKKSLQILIDSIVNIYSALLPDYRRLNMPFDKRVLILVNVLTDYVYIFVDEVENKTKGYTFGYEVPVELRRPLSNIERDRTFLGLSN